MRVVCWFSCGAASAVATKLALVRAKKLGIPVVIAYTEVKEEHEDNKRFLKDCEAWFGQEVVILRNDKYGASINEVFRKERYLVGPTGAACTRLLKKDMRKEFQQPGDRQVFGYTVEEQDRADRFIDSNPDVDLWTILIEMGLDKQACKALLDRAGIKLPVMYEMGYKNNNCIGCVKGGAGYWNKIRKDFPEVFKQRAAQERLLGVKIIKLSKGRVFLDELDPSVGRYEDEPDISCGIACEYAETKLV